MVEDKEKRCVCYLRVSTEKQAPKANPASVTDTDGTSLETQLKACTERAKSLGAAIVGIFQDVQSGSDYKSRPGLQGALQAIESGQAKYLISFKLDRTGRNVDALRDIRRRVQKAGGSIVYADGLNFDNSAVGNLLHTNLSGYAEFEREMIRERTTKGRRQRASQGKQPSTSMRPWGYIIPSRQAVMEGRYTLDQLGTYIVVPSEAKWIRKIFRLYSSGHSLHVIAKYLTTQGIPSPRQSTRWHSQTVRSIIMNPVYKGSATYGRNSFSRDETRLDRGLTARVRTPVVDESEWINIPCPAIVDEALWQTCQKRLKTNQALYSGRLDRKYLLTGILRCPTCGHGLGGCVLWRQRILPGQTARPRPAHGLHVQSCSPWLWRFHALPDASDQ